MKITTEILQETKKVIEENHWTRKTYARNSTRKAVSPTDIEACHFCISGALMRVTGKEPNMLWDPNVIQTLKPFSQLIKKATMSTLNIKLNYKKIPHINDNIIKSKQMVLKILDKAIELSKEETNEIN